MMAKLIDFDKRYAAHVRSWIKANQSRFKGVEDVEAEADRYIGEIYASWLDKPEPLADGLSPKAWFGRMTSAEAFEAFKGYCADKNMDVPMPLTDKIAADPECVRQIAAALPKAGAAEDKFLQYGLDILSEHGIKPYLGMLAEMLSAGACGEDARERITDILTEFAPDVETMLLALIGKDETLDPYLADVLVHCRGREKTFKLLCGLFERGGDCMLYAAYLGMYEDDRALPLLQKRIRSGEADYAEFLELRSAVERLGGEVESAPDFSQDPYFLRMKEIKLDEK